MTTSWQSLVPEHLHAAVHAGLSAVLGAKQIERVETVTGGASGAATLRVQAGKTPVYRTLGGVALRRS